MMKPQQTLGHSLYFLICSLFFSAAAQAQEPLLDAVLKLLSEQEQYHASYVEKKHLSFFDAPLSHSGELKFIPPDIMVRKQNSPKQKTFTITPQQITIETKKELKQVPIDSVPALRAFVVSMQAVLSGDAEVLKAHYDIEAVGNLHDWRLQLKPKDKQLRRYIESIHFIGEQATVNQIQTHEVGGDWSDMQLTSVVQNGG